MSKEIGYREQTPWWWSPESPRPPWQESIREREERKQQRAEFDAELQCDREAERQHEQD